MRKAAARTTIREHNPALRIITALVMITVTLCCMIPFLYIIAMSFSSSSAITNNRVFLWPVDFTLDAYRSVFNYPHFFRAYAYTLIYAFGGTFISLAVMSLFAYPLSKDWLKGRSFSMKLVVFSMFFTGGMIPNYLLVSSLHLTGSVWAMLIPFAINQFCLIILINFFKSIPAEVEEAAKIDGLSYFGILLRIVLPLSRQRQHHGSGRRRERRTIRAGNFSQGRRHPCILDSDHPSLSVPPEVFCQGHEYWSRKRLIPCSHFQALIIPAVSGIAWQETSAH